MKNNNFVYTISDPRTNEIRYVGKTTIGTRRFVDHVSPTNLKGRTKKNSWLKSLRNKNLKPIFDIIEYHETENELNDAEIFYISYFKFLGFKLLNMTEGGDGSSGIIPSKETIEKLRNNSVCKKIVCLNNKTIYHSVAEAGRQLNISAGQISDCVNGKRLTCKNYFFKFHEDSENFDLWCSIELKKLQLKNNEHNRIHTRGPKGRKIICNETKQIFNSITSAAIFFNCWGTQIGGVLNGKYSSYKGHTFSYV